VVEHGSANFQNGVDLDARVEWEVRDTDGRSRVPPCVAKGGDE
jgi:hypothetical protein